MKVTLFLVFVCTLFAVIYSEDCRDDSDCTHLTCDSSSRLACSHGQCTCLVGANPGTCFTDTCSARDDCDSCGCPPNRDHHCFDGHCLCGHRAFGPGGSGVGK
ncbi:serine protease inhibitor Cvsi-2-like [Haliotis rubra]|uniref:serine protease inhibitor Cvsi-2-like n=1 Tax=Haliotis rubra TaxID=36100 RepID=UPI001EE5900F|nr:serine protease inhibitor Cvsi-2-like [Haliotis rubra]